MTILLYIIIFQKAKLNNTRYVFVSPPCILTQLVYNDNNVNILTELIYPTI